MFRFKSKKKRIAELEKEVAALKARLRVTDVFLSEVKEAIREIKAAEKEADDLFEELFGAVILK